MKILGALVMMIAAFVSDDGKHAFVDVGQEIPTIMLDVRYASSDNFIGRPITGYKASKIYISREAASVVKVIQAELQSEKLSLKIFDAYRPQRAVDDFVRWAADPNDIKTKAKYYPEIKKERIIPDGFVAEKSGHSRGSTLDLTIVDAEGHELDMGSGWDYFGAKSHAFYKEITQEQQANRQKLRELMIRHGFKPYDEEWWHFTLKNEPYPETYFDFEID